MCYKNKNGKVLLLLKLLIETNNVLISLINSALILKETFIGEAFKSRDFCSSIQEKV